ncbi:hypothetical protein BC828DRAFT_385088 [Blastocladiella britannica]|nr:hypothetical protein BC828DRAFT_385088 [Blastocladiella britannica]
MLELSCVKAPPWHPWNADLALCNKPAPDHNLAKSKMPGSSCTKNHSLTQLPAVSFVYNTFLPPTYIFNSVWFNRLRRLMIAFTVLASAYFAFLIVYLAVRIGPLRHSDPDKNSAEFIESVLTEYFYAIEMVGWWLYATFALTGLALVMSVIGFVAFLRKHTRLTLLYFVWAVAHLGIYIVVAGVTLVLVATDGGDPPRYGMYMVSTHGTPKPMRFDDALGSWLVILTIMLPNFLLWIALRALVAFVAWMFYTELRRVKMEKSTATSAATTGAAAASAV